MKYNHVWNKVLNANEKVEHEFSVGKGYRLFWLVVWCLIAGLFFIGGGVKSGVGIIILAALYTQLYMPYANAYAFTNKRVLIHRGILSTSAISAEYNKITDVTVEEVLIDKLFTKSGNLMVNTAGSIGKEIVLKNIGKPYETKKKLDTLTRG